MKNKIYLISRIYKPLYPSIEKRALIHTGIPAYYNLIKYLEQDERFEVNILFLLDGQSVKHFRGGNYTINGIKKNIKLVNYYSLRSNNKFIIRLEWLINRIIQYSFLFFFLKNKSIYYLDRDNILLGNILNFKKGLIIYRLLGITEKIYNIICIKKNLLSKLYLRALNLKNKIIISTNDGSWAEKLKENLNDKDFFLMFNGTNLIKEKSTPKIKETLNITCMSRLEPEKGYLELLDILNLLKKKSIKFKVTIIGDGTSKQEIINKVHQLNLIQSVELKGILEHSQIEKCLEKTDLFISYNYLGMFGNNVIEASSKGIPIVALDNEILNSEYKKFFYVIKKSSSEDTVNFIEKFNYELNLRKKYSELSTMFFEKYVVNWNDRMKKELDLIYKKFNNY
tara:strand:- start:276 stop:1463 length:1188 start_codon:yes stop_codon:yes gene_type:complete